MAAWEETSAALAAVGRVLSHCARRGLSARRTVPGDDHHQEEVPGLQIREVPQDGDEAGE